VHGAEIWNTSENGSEIAANFTQYCAGGEIETNEMGRARGAYGGG